MSIVENNEMTPREHLQHEWSVQDFEKQAVHAVNMKKLDIEAQKLETKWATWLKIPLTIVKLPVYCLLAIGVIIAYGRKHEPSDNFWKLLK